MLKKLGIIALIYPLITDLAYGCNDRYLEMEVSANVQKLWAEVPISEMKIRESFGFLNDSKEVDKKYGNPQVFKEIYGKRYSDINNTNFHQFIENCNNIFVNNDSTNYDKISVHILLENVANKYYEELKKFRVLQERKKAYLERKKQTTSVTDKKEFSSLSSNASNSV